MLAYTVTFKEASGFSVAQFTHASLAKKAGVLAEQAAIGAAWLNLTDAEKRRAVLVSICRADHA